MCHNKANKARIKHKKGQYSSLVKPNSVYLIYHKGTLFNRTVAEGVREINAKVAELDYIASQYKEKWEYIDAEARNYFRSRLSAGKLKYITGFNHHGSWNKQINKGRTESKCPRCQETEDWIHVITYQTYERKVKSDLIRKIAKDIKQIPGWEKEEKSIIVMLMDIHQYLTNETQLKSMQGIIGIKGLFWGFIVKN